MANASYVPLLYTPFGIQLAGAVVASGGAQIIGTGIPFSQLDNFSAATGQYVAIAEVCIIGAASSGFAMWRYFQGVNQAAAHTLGANPAQILDYADPPATWSSGVAISFVVTGAGANQVLELHFDPGTKAGNVFATVRPFPRLPWQSSAP